NAEGILTYLLKNTDLQISYNYNVIAIDDKQPKLVGLKEILTSYINFRREVISRRTSHLLEKNQARAHIVEGLIKAVSILDEVIETIRESDNKAHSKVNLINKFDFTEKQAEAIVNLQLYRLSNTDIVQLEDEATELTDKIKEYKEILEQDEVLDALLKKELKETKEEYASPRLTTIENKIEELEVEKEVLVSEEEVIVTLTQQGYLKRTSIRSYASSQTEDISVRSGDQIIYAEKLSTLDQMIIFTNKGKVINRPVHEIPDIRWKDAGKHLSQNITFEADEKIIKAFAFRKLSKDKSFVFITKAGYIKQTVLSDFTAKRNYRSTSSTGIKLQDESDKLMNVYLVDNEKEYDVFLVSKRAYGLRYTLEEVSTYGPNAKGLISMNLKENDHIVAGLVADTEKNRAELMMVTDRGSVKKMNIFDIDPISRAKRGLRVLRKLKTNPHEMALAFPVFDPEESISLITDQGKEFTFKTKDYNASDRYNNGSFILDENEDGRPISYRRDDLIYEKNK
ncbi:MAG: DNA topoisomerase (ATP-hydrolyzing) subunit A, partial [Atopostipes sp.]|nr:DNA topoisomerase (ATP-hydrolyzing) subunit A [Atopostipes sp.]